MAKNKGLGLRSPSGLRTLSQHFLQLDSAAQRNELTYAREKIRKALNREAGSEVIDEIVFR